MKYDAMQCDAMQCSAVRCSAIQCDAMSCEAGVVEEERARNKQVGRGAMDGRVHIAQVQIDPRQSAVDPTTST